MNLQIDIPSGGPGPSKLQQRGGVLEMYSNVGEGFVALFKLMVALLAITIPLGIWKLIDIAVWLFRNVTINFGG